MIKNNSSYLLSLKLVILALGLALCDCGYFNKFLSSDGPPTYFITKDTGDEIHEIEIGNNMISIQSGITHYGNIFVNVDLEVSGELTYFPDNLEIVINGQSMSVEHIIHSAEAAPDSAYVMSNSKEFLEYWLPREKTKSIRDSRQLHVCGDNVFLYKGNYAGIDTVSFIFPYSSRGKFNRPRTDKEK